MCKLKKDLLKELYNYKSSTYKNLNEEEIDHLYFSQKQLPSAWNESDWLTNCRLIHIVKLRENRKRFS